MRWGEFRRCATMGLAFSVSVTLSRRRPPRSRGELRACLASRVAMRSIISGCATRRLAVASTRCGRTNPRPRGSVCAILAKRTRAVPAIFAGSRRTNPRPSNPTNVISAKRTHACASLRAPSWPNEPEQQTRAASRLFRPNKPEPEPEQTMYVLPRRPRRGATARVRSWPNEPERQPDLGKLWGTLAAKAGLPGFTGVTRRLLPRGWHPTERAAFSGEPGSPQWLRRAYLLAIANPSWRSRRNSGSRRAGSRARI